MCSIFSVCLCSLKGIGMFQPPNNPSHFICNTDKISVASHLLMLKLTSDKTSYRRHLSHFPSFKSKANLCETEMNALLKRRFTAKKFIICIFGLATLGLLLQIKINPHHIVTQHTLTNRRDTSQSHQYNVTSLSQEPKCRVRIIYNLNSSGLKEVQDERESRIKDVCDMCRRNGSCVGCNHVALDKDYQDRQDFYGNLVVDEKHKVKNFLAHFFFHYDTQRFCYFVLQIQQKWHLNAC